MIFLIVPALAILIATSSGDSTDLARFVSPLVEQPGPLVILHSADSTTWTRGRRTLAILAPASIRADGLYFGPTYLPEFGPQRWGYPEEQVVGMVSGTLFGLEDRGGSRAEDGILKVWEAWGATRRPPLVLPTLAHIRRATIVTSPAWTMERAINLIESLQTLVPGARHAEATLAPRRGSYAVRQVAMADTASTGASLATLNIDIAPRPAGRRPNEIFDHVTNTAFSSMTFTTDHSLVRVDLTPSRAIGDFKAWRARFAEIEKE